METKNKDNLQSVFVVLEDWKIDSGESGIFTSIFATFEGALDYYEKLKKDYEIDYDTKERQANNEVYHFSEDINEELKCANIIVSFEDSADYYEIDITEKKVNEYLD